LAAQGILQLVKQHQLHRIIQFSYLIPTGIQLLQFTSIKDCILPADIWHCHENTSKNYRMDNNAKQNFRQSL